MRFLVLGAGALGGLFGGRLDECSRILAADDLCGAAPGNHDDQENILRVERRSGCAARV